MAKNIVSLGMLRNSSLFNGKAAAIAGITGGATNDGVIKLARYNEGEGTSAKTKTIFGIYNDGTIGKSGYTLYDFDTDAEATLNALVNLINGNDATEGSFRYAIKEAVEALDYSATTEAGKFVTNVTEADGVISVSFDTVSASVVAQSSEKAAISGAATVQAALNALADKAEAITISNADGSINVTPANGGTDINVNIKSGEHVLAKAGNAGLYTDIKLSSVTASDVNVKEQYALIATDGSKLGAEIKIYKDSAYKEIYLGTSADTINTTTGEITKLDGDKQSLNYVYMKADGTFDLVKVDVSKFLVESEFASGVVSTSGIVHGVVDGTSEAFLTVGADGFKLAGVQDAITAAVNALDVTGDTAVAGQYVAAIEETDGIVAVKTRANVSEAVLNNYNKGTDATAVVATDTVNQAVSKLENQIDKAKAAATTKVEKDANADHLTLTSSTGSDGSVTYTIGQSDIASDSALTAEIAARKAVDGQAGQTYAANGSANYISGATSLNDADVKLDTQVKANADAIAQEIVDRNAAISAAVQTLDVDAITAGDGEFIKSVNEVDGKISATTAEMPTVAQIAENGKPIVAVSQSKGTVSASVGTIDAQYVNIADAGELFTATTVEAALAEIDTAYKAADTALETKLVNGASASADTFGEIEQIINNLSTDARVYQIATATPSNNNTLASYVLKDQDGNVSGVTVDIPKDRTLLSVAYTGTGESGQAGQFLKFVYALADGSESTVYVDMSELVTENEAASGIAKNSDGVLHGVVDSTSETFLTVDAGGFKLAGVQNAIDAAKASATTVVVEGTDAGNNIEIVESAGADGHKIFTLNVSDIASATKLASTIGGAGLNADGTYSTNTATTYINNATSLKDADEKLDAAISGLAGNKLSGVTVNGAALAVSKNVASQTVQGKLTEATPVGNEAIVVETDANGNLTLGIGILDCGTY